jgi:esterase
MTAKGELAVGTVTAKGATPDRWIVFLHGILGSGANWRTFARQITAARPQWGALLVDIRLHGDSVVDFDPPHTLESAARDIVFAIQARPGTSVHAVLGHSFGGKVGIDVVRQLAATPHGAPNDLFVIDSTPGARPDYRGSSGVRDIVELLMTLPDEFPDRNAFTSLVEERGVSRPIAMWLAMNVRPVPNSTRFVFRIDVPAVRAMMEDYFQQDLWPVLEDPPTGQDGRPMRTHLISGGKSQVFDASDLERARRLPDVTVDVIEDAGHWVHVDAPDILRELVLGYLE